MKKIILLFSLLFIANLSFSQTKIGNLANPANENAVLDVESANKGVLLPRMTTTQRDAIASPTEGLTIYNTDDHQYQVYNGNDWAALAGLADNAVTTSKILDANITTSKIANNAVSIAKLPAGATATTFLRGDGSWTSPLNLYNSDGSLSGDRIVSQAANRLAFTSTAVNGFSVGGTTFSVDAANYRIGLGTDAPAFPLDIRQAQFPQLNINTTTHAGIFLTRPSTSLTTQFRFVTGSVEKWRFGSTDVNDNLIYDYYNGPGPNSKWNPLLVLAHGGNNGATANAGVGINTGTIDSKAILDISSTTKGVLMPRMTTTQRDAISSPTEGLTIYNTTVHQYQVYNGSAWEALGGGLFPSVDYNVSSPTGSRSTNISTLSTTSTYNGGLTENSTHNFYQRFEVKGTINVWGYAMTKYGIFQKTSFTLGSGTNNQQPSARNIAWGYYLGDNDNRELISYDGGSNLYFGNVGTAANRIHVDYTNGRFGIGADANASYKLNVGGSAQFSGNVQINGKINTTTAGTVTLAGQTVTVNNSNVSANSVIILTPQQETDEVLSLSSKTAGTGFTIRSSNANSTITVGYIIIN